MGDIFLGISKLHNHHEQASEMVVAAREMIYKMPMILIQPLLEAVVKYLVAIHLVYGFMWLVSAGHLDTHRIVINGSYFVGYSKSYVYENADLVVLFMYILGCVWVMEVISAFFQFVLSSEVVAYYYTPKEDDTKNIQSGYLLKASKNAVLCHFGTICIGAVVSPPTRMQRMVYTLHDEHQDPRDMENENDDDRHRLFRSGVGRLCGSCCLKIGKCGRSVLRRVAFFLFFPCIYLFRRLPLFDTVNLETYTKDAYTDTAIRATDYLQAAEHVRITTMSHKVVLSHLGACNSLAWCLIFGIASLSSGMTLLMMLQFAAFADPASKSYIPDPIVIATLDFVLCCYISYGFLNILEHAADSLLVCYAFNRRYDRRSVERYIPDAITCVVGWEDKSEQYAFDADVNQLMYLRTWLSKKGRYHTRPGLLETMASNFGAARDEPETQSLIEG